MDKSDLRKNYQSYSDEKIISILKKSFNNLLPEAQGVLIEEIESRKIDLTNNRQLSQHVRFLQYCLKKEKLKKLRFLKKL
jgi:hypothetical protein